MGSILEVTSTTERPVIRFPEAARGNDLVVVEEPLEIRIDDLPLVVTMRTPGHDAELAAGFCLSEGVVDSADDIERVEPCFLADYGNVVAVTLSDEASSTRSRQVSDARREFYLSSSCGLCGAKTIDRIEKKIRPLIADFVVRRDTLDALTGRMIEAQKAFALTGGLHAAALFDPEGNLRLLREDIGRHNAVDKIIGALLLSGQLTRGPAILLVSGRVSFEIVQKAAMAGIAFLAAVGAPTSLAIDAAARFGMTLVGFLRDNRRFNVYHDRSRIA